MPLNFPQLINEYSTLADDLPIEYYSSNTWTTEQDSRLRNISRAIQQRPNRHIKLRELRSIGVWKTGGNRIDRHLEKNTENQVISCSINAFERQSTPVDRVEALQELDGVQVPMASAILACFDPSSFAVIDFRAIRALPSLQPSMVDPASYGQYAAFMDLFRRYQAAPALYAEYLDKMEAIATSNSLSLREVDMALWTYDFKYS